jgi:DNA-binding transcriptional ArsR family regulator
MTITIYRMIFKGHNMIQFKERLEQINFERKAHILKAIAHPIRLRIIYGVSKKACNVKSMWQCLDLPQDVVSQHLAILRKKNILITRKEGNSVYYSVSPEIDIKGILDFLDFKFVPKS